MLLDSSVTKDEAAGYQQTVTNTYQPTTLLLTNRWVMNGSSDAHPSSLELSVYTSEDKNVQNRVGVYTLNEANDWKYTVSQLGSDNHIMYIVMQKVI